MLRSGCNPSAGLRAESLLSLTQPHEELTTGNARGAFCDAEFSCLRVDLLSRSFEFGTDCVNRNMTVADSEKASFLRGPSPPSSGQ